MILPQLSVLCCPGSVLPMQGVRSSHYMHFCTSLFLPPVHGCHSVSLFVHILLPCKMTCPHPCPGIHVASLIQTLSLKFCKRIKISSPGDLQESCGESDCLQTMQATTQLEYVRRVVNRSDQTRLRRACASNRSYSP